MKIAYEKTLLSSQNKWIAVSSDRSDVLATGKSIKEVEDKLVKLRSGDAIITFVPPADKYISPLSCP